MNMVVVMMITVVCTSGCLDDHSGDPLEVVL